MSGEIKMTSVVCRRMMTVVFLMAATPAVAASGPVQWIWSGAVTPTSAIVKAKVNPGASQARLIVGERSLPAELVGTTDIVTFQLEGLAPGTDYTYQIEVSGSPYLSGHFRTFDDGPMSFRFVFGSCARTGSTHRVFETMESLEPLFMLHMGDFHYENIGENDPAKFRDAFDGVLASPRQSSLFRSAPIAYIWDDHDYGPNDADRTHPGKPAALATYDETVPHYPLARGEGGTPIDLRQAFSVGRVRFVLTDVRSHRDPDSEPDGPDKTMLGVDQREWLLKELETAATTHALIAWVNVVPWIAEPGNGHGWGLYDWERRFIADRIRALRLVNRLVVLSGDAHMVAIDDGTNSNFATRAEPGEHAFPVIHAAPLDRYARPKGGPYSHGKAARRILFGLIPIQQFGLADIVDDGNVLDVTFTGRNEDGELLDGMSLHLRCDDGCRIAADPNTR